MTKIEEIPYFESLGSKFFKSDAEVLTALNSPDYLGVILATPEQISQFKDTGSRLPFIIRHGLNSFTKFNKHETKNFITCCRRAADKIPNCHYFLNRKLLRLESFNPQSDATIKTGFYSYIHHYHKWGNAYEKFNKLNLLLGEDKIENYGAGTPNGEVPDLVMMDSSRATVHIKDGNAVCNAVIRSMAMETPVVMDRETFEKCYFDDIKGIIVKESIAEVSEELKRLLDDNYLDDAIQNVLDNRNQFMWDQELGDRFIHFLSHLKV